MAKVGTATVRAYTAVKKSRPGVHAKSGTSNLKSSKKYKKKYAGQGKKR